jgi:hypothetical protein
MINRLPVEYRVPQKNHAAEETNELPKSSQPVGFFSRLGVKATRCIGGHPAASLAAACVSGLALGRWIKR